MKNHYLWIMIILDKFPTHIEKTNNKFAPNKFIKITNQSIYNGALNRFARAIVVNNMHDYIISCIPKELTKIDTPCKPIYEFHTVRNHGNIRRLKDGNLSWKKPDDDFEATWDDDNLAFLWMKTIRDAFTKAGLWVDDNVDFVRGGDYDVKFVDHIDDRKIIIKFKKI